MPAFPPEPWLLTGQAYVSAFLVPARRLAELTATDTAIPGFVPVNLAGRALVCAAWFGYDDRGGVLAYNEIMTVALVRRGWQLRMSVTHIWVDSVVSRDGGRALWGIPKDLAAFEVETGGSYRATLGSAPIASARITAQHRLPGRWPLRFSLVQRLAGAPKVSPVRARGGLALVNVCWDVPPGGPIGFLAGRRARCSLGLLDFRLIFGAAAGRLDID